MKIIAWSSSLVLCLFLSGVAFSQSKSGEGIPIQKLVDAVAQQTGKKFVLDPRVTTQVTLVNLEPRSLGYADLLTILEVHGLVAREQGDLVTIQPDANARQVASPLLGSNKLPDSQFVTAVLAVKSVSAPQLVPILRPLLPQHAHLAAFPQTNTLIVADSYANVQRIKSLVEALDKGPPWKADRDAGEPSKPAKPE